MFEALADGVRSDGDADGGEHGLQGEQHHVRLYGLEVVIEERDRHLGDGGGDLLGRERRCEIENGGGLLAVGGDAGAVGGNSETPQEDLGERGLCDFCGDFFLLAVVRLIALLLVLRIESSICCRYRERDGCVCRCR